MDRPPGRRKTGRRRSPLPTRARCRPSGCTSGPIRLLSGGVVSTDERNRSRLTAVALRLKMANAIPHHQPWLRSLPGWPVPGCAAGPDHAISWEIVMSEELPTPDGAEPSPDTTSLWDEAAWPEPPDDAWPEPDEDVPVVAPAPPPARAAPRRGHHRRLRGADPGQRGGRVPDLAGGNRQPGGGQRGEQLGHGRPQPLPRCALPRRSGWAELVLRGEPAPGRGHRHRHQ